MKDAITKLLVEKLWEINCTTCKWYDIKNDTCDGSCTYGYNDWCMSEEYAEEIADEICDIVIKIW